MNIPAVQPTVHAADVPLEHLAGNSHVSEKEKIAEACRQFEAILVGQILREAQPKISTGVAGSIYQDLATTQLADAISRSGSFGLARTLSKQL
jgi:Rod binding domain-containing protein